MGLGRSPGTAVGRIGVGWFRRLVALLPWAAGVTVICVVAFAWLSSPPKPGGVMPDAAVAATIVLRPTTDLAGLGLGDAHCRARSLDGVIVGGTLEEPVVTVPPQHGCAAAEFEVSEDLGVVIPRTTPPISTKESVLREEPIPGGPITLNPSG